MPYSADQDERDKKNVPDKGVMAAVVMLEVIEHVPSTLRQSASKEVMRVLRDSGILILATPNRLFLLDEHALFQCQRRIPDMEEVFCL